MIFSIKSYEIARKKLPNIELHIVGDGPMRDELIDYVQKNDLSKHVYFHGTIDPFQLPQFMNLFDVFLQHSIVDSHGWREGFGVSIAEAASSGLPVIAKKPHHGLL